MRHSLFIIALVLYTIAIHAHRVKRNLKPWMMWIFGAGLSADLLGTIFLCVASATTWRWNAHSIWGLAALIIMATHFAWGIAALKNVGRWGEWFNRFSLAAWTIWLVAFVSGVPIKFWEQVFCAVVIIAVTYLVRDGVRYARKKIFR